jgi:hypothetical protein
VTACPVCAQPVCRCDPQKLAEKVLARHPLQYGYRAGEREPIFDPGDDATVGERYNRCPVCEEWSPCSVRVVLDALVALAASGAEAAARERHAYATALAAEGIDPEQWFAAHDALAASEEEAATP